MISPGKLIHVLKSNVIFRNLVSMSVIHGLGMVLPLITYPYLIKVIGIGNFGKIGFLISSIIFAGFLIDFGYAYIAPKEVATNRNNEKSLSEVFSNIIISKFILLIICCLLAIVSTAFIDKYDIRMILLGLVYLVGLASTPNWFFQGIEKMHWITIFDGLSKIIATILVFVLIKKQSDSVLYLPILGVGSILCNLLGYIYIFSNYNIRISISKFHVLLNGYKNGLPIFVGLFSTYLIANSSMILLGILSTPYLLGLFAIADKIGRIPWIFSNLMSTVIYPSVCRDATLGLNHIWIILRKYIGILLLFTVVLVLLGYYFAIPIIHIFYKSNTEEILPVYLALLINTFFITLIIPFTLILLAYSRNRIYMRINVFISLFQFGVSYYFIKYYGIFGAGISTLIAYCTLLVIMIFVYFAEKSKGNLQTVISS